MIDPDGGTNRLRLPAELTRLAQAREWCRLHAARCGVSGPGLADMELAVTEAVSNVIRHGYGEDPAQVIELVVESTDDALVLVIRDRGPVFDPTLLPSVDLNEPTTGGYGVHLIHSVMDDVVWRRQGGWNELRLVRLLQPHT
jgi:serine/threonine-protein kinase RsbW